MISRTYTLLGGLALILAFNGVVLGKVAWNRSAVDSQPQLSQRELSIHETNWDNSGVEISLNWRSPTHGDQAQSSPSIFLQHEDVNEEKLRELGVNLSETQASLTDYKNQPDRRVLLVLEFNGPLYQREVTLAKQALEKAQNSKSKKEEVAELRKKLNEEELLTSRLLLRDVGLDLHTLRSRYTDPQRYIIIHGKLSLNITRSDDQPPSIYGNVYAESAINVPLDWREAAFEIMQKPYDWQAKTGKELKGWANPQAPFSAEIAFGRELEPWLINLKQP